MLYSYFSPHAKSWSAQVYPGTPTFSLQPENFSRKLKCRAVRTALHLFLCVLSCGIRKQPAHRLGGFGLRKRCDVSVSVKREASRVVAEHPGDRFDVHAVLQSQGCKCVTKIMEAKPWQSRTVEHTVQHVQYTVR